MRSWPKRGCMRRNSRHTMRVTDSGLARPFRPLVPLTQEEQLPLYRCAESEGIRTRSHCPRSIRLEDTRGRAAFPCPFEFASRPGPLDHKETIVSARLVKKPLERPN